MHKFLFFFLSIIIFTAARPQKKSLKKLKKEIEATLKQQTGFFAVAFKDLQTGKIIFINEHEIFHAASTMKTPVLIEAYKQAAEGKLKLTDSVSIINNFKSIVDTSHFSLSAADDSEYDLYKHIGEKALLYDLIYKMIIYSSNLATNIVIDKLGAANVTTTIRSLGAKDIQVLRGVEDGKAFDKGLNNVVSAFDLALLFDKMANNKIVSDSACHGMIKILLDQKFNDVIPAKLPPAVKVAHKTGWITGTRHDSGIVFLPNGKKYVLVLLSKNLTDDKAGIETMAAVSKLIYDYVSQAPVSN